MNTKDRDRVIRIAKSWVGYNYKKGQKAQCANFVRSVFDEAKVYVGVASHPTDENLIPNEPLGPSYANSFAGDDVGPKIDISKRESGDIIMYKNTYGNYKEGVITHVAIYVGDNKIIHRPTSDKPVRVDNYDYMSIAEIRRIKSPVSSIYLNILEGSLISSSFNNEDTKIKVFINKGKFRIFINNKEVDDIKALNLFIKCKDNIYFISNNECSHNGKEVDNLELIITLKDDIPNLSINKIEDNTCSFSLLILRK